MGEVMISLLKPDYYFNDIFSIDLDLLLKQGIKGIICDIDNTIVPWSEKRVLLEVADWFNAVKNKDFRICLVSNGMDRRVSFFSEELEVPAIGQAVKPTRKAFKLAKDKLGLNSSEIAMIGDQIFTDILGGNRMGFKTILVDPMSEEELFSTKIIRKLEKLVFERSGL